MSTHNLSNDAQIRYMVQWFAEWSELQRQDFVPILAEKIAVNGVYMNGVLSSMGSINCQDKPMNLFQCRVKLFNEWYTNWTEEERDRLVKNISDLDKTFSEKLQEEIYGDKSEGNLAQSVQQEEPLTNGHSVDTEQREEVSVVNPVPDVVAEAVTDAEEDVQSGLAVNSQSMPIEITATS